MIHSNGEVTVAISSPELGRGHVRGVLSGTEMLSLLKYLTSVQHLLGTRLMPLRRWVQHFFEGAKTMYC